MPREAVAGDETERPAACENVLESLEDLDDRRDRAEVGKRTAPTGQERSISRHRGNVRWPRLILLSSSSTTGGGGGGGGGWGGEALRRKKKLQLSPETETCGLPVAHALRRLPLYCRSLPITQPRRTVTDDVEY